MKLMQDIAELLFQYSVSLVFGAVSCANIRNTGFFDSFRQSSDFSLGFVVQMKAADETVNLFLRERSRQPR